MARARKSVRLDAELTTKKRNNLEESEFAIPSERRFPIHDISHARNALARSGGTASEKQVKEAVYKKFPSLADHAEHDSPQADCAHCMDDMDAAQQAEQDADNAASRKAAALTAEHDEKHGRQTDCPACKARKDGAACDQHVDDNLALEHGGPIPTAPVSGISGSMAEPMRGPAGEGSPAKTEGVTDPQTDPEDDEDDAEPTHADDTLTPNGPIAVPTTTGGESEPNLAGNRSANMQPPAPAAEGALANANTPQIGSTVDPWLPQGPSQPHPMTGKTVRFIKRGGEGGSIAEDGGRITHGNLGKVESVDMDGNTALVDFDGHGKLRTSLINLEEAKQKPEPVHADGTRLDRADGVRRFDIGELEKPEFLPNGWVKVDGFIARAGLLTYKTDSGEPWVEYRPPEEAFSQATLDSFELVPLTNKHPAEGLLDADNTARYQTGSIAAPRKDGDKVRTKILVTDSDTVRDMKRGRVELSCGYTCDVENKPGMLDGKRYDAVQRNVRGNHVALVDVGRAGAEVRVRMDGLGMVQLSSQARVSAPKDPTLTTKIKIDSVEYDVSESGAQAFRKHMETAAKLNDRERARADASETDVKRLKGELAIAPEKARAAIEHRATIEQSARKIVGDEPKFDGLSDLAVKRLAVEKTGVKLDGRSDTYVEAAFDFAIEHAHADAGVLAIRAPTEGALAPTSNANALQYLEKSLAAAEPKTRK